MSQRPIIDWHGNQRDLDAQEVARAEATAARVRREVAEIREAADRLAGSGESAVADFLHTQATLPSRPRCLPPGRWPVRWRDQPRGESPQSYPRVALNWATRSENAWTLARMWRSSMSSHALSAAAMHKRKASRSSPSSSR